MDTRPEQPGFPQSHRPMAVVVLEHRLQDGTVHWDLLVEQGVDGPLAAWRCPSRPDHLAPGAVVSIEAMSPHRRSWLYEEGPLSGDRGMVLRVNAGMLCIEAAGQAQVQWTTGGSCTWVMASGARLECLAAQSVV